MKEFSAIRKENEEWLFDYRADTNPGRELALAGAILTHQERGEVGLGSGLQNARYQGSAYTRPNTEYVLRAVQERLRTWGWRPVTPSDNG